MVMFLVWISNEPGVHIKRKHDEHKGKPEYANDHRTNQPSHWVHATGRSHLKYSLSLFWLAALLRR